MKTGTSRASPAVCTAVVIGFRVDVFHRPATVKSYVESDVARNPGRRKGIGVAAAALSTGLAAGWVRRHRVSLRVVHRTAAEHGRGSSRWQGSPLIIRGAVELWIRPRALAVRWGHEPLVGCRALRALP